MADYSKMISALEGMDKKVDHEGFADRMSDPDFAERVRKQLATKYNVQDSAAFYNTYNPEAPLPEATEPDTVQGGVVFMHPTTPEKAKAYAENEIPWYRKPDFGLSGNKQIGTITQEEADARNANAGDAYTLGRNVLTTGIAPYVAGAEYAKDRLFGEGGWAAGEKPYTEYLNEHLTSGNKGEGVTGFVGDPTNLLGGISKPLQGMRVVGNPLVRGGLEGAAISGINQAHMGDGSISATPLAIGTGLGAVGTLASDVLGAQVAKQKAFQAEQKLSKEDPIAYIWDHPEVNKAQTVQAKQMNEIDPNGLYTQYNQSHVYNPKTGAMEMSGSSGKELLKAAKKDIAERSIVPRKMSTITDREAREHLENVVKNVESVPAIDLDVTPKNPLDNIALDLGKSGLGAIGGHYVFGIPGLVGGALLASPSGRKLVESTAKSGLKLGTKIAVSPLGEAAGLIPYAPLTIQASDKLHEMRQENKGR